MRKPLQKLQRTAWPLAMSMLAIGGPASAADYLSMSGKELYGRFCAACHGAGGRGNGPVASSFAIEVPDLTAIARRRGGQFPPELIERVIDGRHVVGAHGSREMPVWGEEFARSEIGNPDAERATRTVIARIADYLREIQRMEKDENPGAEPDHAAPREALRP